MGQRERLVSRHPAARYHALCRVGWGRRCRVRRSDAAHGKLVLLSTRVEMKLLAVIVDGHVG